MTSHNTGRRRSLSPTKHYRLQQQQQQHTRRRSRPRSLSHSHVPLQPPFFVHVVNAKPLSKKYRQTEALPPGCMTRLSKETWVVNTVTFGSKEAKQQSALQQKIKYMDCTVKRFQIPSGIDSKQQQDFLERCREMLAHEATMLRFLKHPSIPSLISHTQDCLVTSFSRGMDLQDHVCRYGPFSLVEASHLTRQLLSIVRDIHAMGVIHRDIKPENIIYDASTRTIKLHDFGLAQFFYGQALDVSGSYEYAAPELSDHDIGPHNDVFSCGATIFALVMGYCIPFMSKTCKQLDVTRALHMMYDVKLPLVLQDFISSLVERNPSKRSTLKQALQHPWVPI